MTEWPEDGLPLLFRLYDTPATSARLLKGGKQLKFDNTSDGIYIHVPRRAPDPIISVIELEFDQALPRYVIKPMNTRSYQIVDIAKD